MAIMPETIEQALDSCLEKITHQSASIEACLLEFPQYHDQLAEMLPLLVSLKSLHQITPSESFTKDAPNRLISKLPSAPVTFRQAVRLIFEKQILYPIRRFGMLRLIFTLLITLSLLTGGTNLVQAAGPGDLLYPLDLAFEQLRLRITIDPVKEAALRLQYAGERLEEAEAMLGLGKLEHALTALSAYDDAIVDLEEQVENVDGQVRAAVRTMTQEELALQAGTLDRIRLSWPEDAQARNAYQKALQRSNRGVEQLFGPPETVPQGPSEEVPQGPSRQDAQGPVEKAPQGPNQEAPQGPSEEMPYGPAEEAPYSGSEEAPNGPSDEAPHGPPESAPHGSTQTPPKGPTNTTP
jgi:hypothetical protein